ncbi:MAG: proline racemase family protein [Planctomycetales bacterium]|nr:proline racemase family protein [Planctomycetales bacterium]
MRQVQRVQVVDSHTAGEPTRVVVEGGPDLGTGSLAERRERLDRDHRSFCSGVVREPRGSDVLVGALLCDPYDPSCEAGVIFFNNVGSLGMCGHGAIGVMATLRHLQRITMGKMRLDTPVGMVTAASLDDDRFAVDNVESFRHAAGVTVEVAGHGPVSGDVAWGGNWFFLTESSPCPLELANVEQLQQFARAVRCALASAGVTGEDGAEIDHIELFGPPRSGGDARNFVLCPGGVYDRSPCGTGTSAKLACLVAEGKLRVDATWRQEGILGSIFEARCSVVSDAVRGRPVIRPTIVGDAYLIAESTLRFDEADPFCWGLPAEQP